MAVAELLKIAVSIWVKDEGSTATEGSLDGCLKVFIYSGVAGWDPVLFNYY